MSTKMTEPRWQDMSDEQKRKEVQNVYDHEYGNLMPKRNVSVNAANWKMWDSLLNQLNIPDTLRTPQKEQQTISFDFSAKSKSQMLNVILKYNRTKAVAVKSWWNKQVCVCHHILTLQSIAALERKKEPYQKTQYTNYNPIWKI